MCLRLSASPTTLKMRVIWEWNKYDVLAFRNAQDSVLEVSFTRDSAIVSMIMNPRTAHVADTLLSQNCSLNAGEFEKELKCRWPTRATCQVRMTSFIMLNLPVGKATAVMPTCITSHRKAITGCVMGFRITHSGLPGHRPISYETRCCCTTQNWDELPGGGGDVNIVWLPLSNHLVA